MLGASNTRWAAVATVVAAAAVGCGEPPNGPDPDEPDPIASVEVTSPIGDKMALGRQLQLSASAMTADGDDASPSFTWTSSDQDVALVDGGGLVDGLAAGPTTISATAEGVTGDLPLTVVDVDLEGIANTVGDAYAERLIAALPDASMTALEQVVGDCVSAVDEGHVNDLIACLEAGREAVQSPSTGDETVIFSYLTLYLDRADQLLNL